MSRKRILRLGATLLVVGLVAYLFGRGLADNWDAAREIDLSVNGLSLLAVVLLAASVVSSGLLWGSMTSELGNVHIGRAEAVRVHCASWLLKYVPGQVGSVANKILWGSGRGVSKTLVVITFVYENVFLLLASTIPTVVVLVLDTGVIGGDSLTAVLPALLALVPLLLVMDRRIFRWAINLVGRRALKKDVPPEYFLGPRAAAKFQLQFVVPRILNAAGFIAVAESFLTIETSEWLALGCIYVLAGAVGILAVLVPSGIGVRESVIVLLASRYMPVEQAIVLSLVARLYSTVADAAVAAIYGTLKFRESKKGRSE
ncbi:lysylphosphatidylglycerol synthase domain-containing protein [Sanguibacter antarcticus]|uniref:Uncharacterized membrane protein YbhN (UPF0104 family) n=1 Tax=Sanguibacter antarcticus TaxID=372484 RepID=A0A2A9E2E3_9MICO|nr:lysylphosphatidylglycerol synthase domain-containing protein [Sanguibacter antarcticus]PFG32525.1 uncharacterized membrane protein YbhN (UPF0104 family) [Sanguibacter antarcticus]